MASALDARRNDTRHRLERVLDHSLREQAICVFEAAAMVLPQWQSWEKANQLPPLADNLRQCFLHWLRGLASDRELENAGEELFKVLPKDLTKMETPWAGEAGYALLDVSLIALEKCEGLHLDILFTAVLYAAAAATNSTKSPINLGCESLTTEECDFLERWWSACCQQLPNLAG